MIPDDSSARCLLLDQLAEEIAARYRRGERPTLHEYLERYPNLADDLRELFPALVQVEQVKDDQEALTTPAPPPLRQFGDYRVLREIGRGGMGVVYEAEQISLGRRVALKVLPAQLLTLPSFRSRFEREARAAARLHHTNIVPVFGVGEHEGTPYYAMQFIQGQGLDAVLAEVQRLQGGLPETVAEPASGLAHSLLAGMYPPALPAEVTPLPAAQSGQSPEALLPGRNSDNHRRLSYWQSVATIGRQVAEALDYAHKQGVTHRDIKPSNLLLDTHGTVWVTDFGLAKADDQANLTRTGDLLGTLRYMPPEAFDGKSDRRGDIYSLGLTLYELLALRPAFDERDRARLLRKVTDSTVVRLESLKRGIPTDLATIVHKAIDPDPAHRYQTAGDLAADLQRFLADEPIHARRLGVLERTRRWCRKNPVGAALVALVALVLTAAVVVPITVAHALSVEQGKTQAALTSSQAAEKKALRQAATSVLERAVGLCDSGEAVPGLVWLSHGLELAIRAGAPDLEDAFRWNLAAWSERVPSLVAVLPVPASADTVALSPDDAIVAAACRDGKVRQWQLPGSGKGDGTPAGPDLPHPGRVQCLAFLRDGKTLLTGAEDGIARLWNRETGQELRRLVHYDPPPGLAPEWPFTRGVTRLAITPDGKLAVTAGRDDRLQFWSLPDGQPVGGPLRIQGAIFSLAFSPDSRTLLVAHQWSISHYDATSRERIGTEIQLGSAIYQVAWAPDGRNFAAGALQSCSVERFSLAGSRPSAASLTHRAAVTGVGFTSDGRWIVSAGEDQVVRWWNATTGAPGGPSLPQGSAIHSLAMSRNRPLFAIGGDGAVRLWRLPANWPSQETGQHAGWPRAVVFSADNRRLLIGETSASKEGSRLVPFDLATGRLGPPLLVQPWEGWVQSMALSPDGQTLYTASNTPGCVHRWEATTGRRLGRLADQDDQVWRLALSPDGTRLATGTFDYFPAPKGSSARLWDVASGAPIGAPLAHGGKVFGLAFRPDGAALLTGSHDHTTRLWDAATGLALSQPCQHDAEVWSVAYHPDGRRAVLGLGNGTARLWDVSDSRPAGPALRHAAGIHHVQFLAEGQLVLTCSADGTARLWHTATGHPVGPTMTHTRAITAGCVSPDGRLVATAGDDLAARIWPVASPMTGSVEAIRREVESRTNLALDEDSAVRVLSPADWQERTGRTVRPADTLPAPAPVKEQLPLQIILAGPVEERPATPEQIREWLAALAGPQPGPALRALAAAGPAVLPDLARAEVAAEEPVRALLRQLRDRLEIAALVRPRRVTLRLDRAPLDAAVVALAKESGLPLVLGEAANSDLVVSLDFKGVPAWQMLDELRRQANLNAEWRDGNYVLGRGQGIAPELVAYPGPFRLQVAAMNRNNYQYFGDFSTGARSSTTSLHITLNLALANRETVVATGQPRVTSATTDEGDRVSVSITPGGFLDTLGSPVPFRAHVLNLNPLKQSARTLTLEGVVPVEVLVKVSNQLDLKAPAERVKQLVPLADGGYIRWATPLGPGIFPVEIILPAGRTLDSRKWLVELIDERGRTIRGDVQQPPVFQPLSVPFRPEDALWLAAPEAGPWAALGLQTQGQRVHIAWLKFNSPEPPGPKSRLRVSLIQREIAELPFTFKNLPLP
jgi:WD40 repeat protein/serine/threonine protein kinase